MCASVAAGKYSAEVSVFDLRQVFKKKKKNTFLSSRFPTGSPQQPAVTFQHA